MQLIKITTKYRFIPFGGACLCLLAFCLLDSWFTSMYFFIRLGGQRHVLNLIVSPKQLLVATP